jgi:hypothetical protein
MRESLDLSLDSRPEIAAMTLHFPLPALRRLSSDPIGRWEWP